MSGRGLALRTPALEWAHRAASGEMDGLSWVSTDIHPEFVPYRQFDENEQRRFRHRPFSRWQPPALVDAAVQAQRAGVPTAWEAMLLVFARTEWLMKSREYLWTPHSPQPQLLGTLVESFGVDASLHARNSDVLRRLTALLPTWHPYRGTVERAREVLDICGMSDQLAKATTQAESGIIPAQPGLEGEVMACHVSRWWALRRQPDSSMALRIEDGLVRFQAEDDAQKWVLRREDVLVEWAAGTTLPRQALRLLPAWSVVRLARKIPKKRTRKSTDRSAANRAADESETSKTSKTKKAT